MTAKEMISKVIILLGYSDEQGNTSDSRFQVISKNALNFVYSDLFYCLNSEGFKEIKALSEEIPLPERILYDVMPYGVAAFIAESLGDGEKQQYFAVIYNSKKASLTHYDDMETDVPYPYY
nr:MAG TPA: hypothetical protein [Caudoviricetes sp.]